MARKLSPEDIDWAAEQVALGIPKEKVAEEIGVEPGSLSAMLASEKGKERLASHRERVEAIVETSMTRLAMGLEDAVSNILEDLRDPTSKTRLETSWRVVDRVVPKTQSQDLTVRHVVDGKVLAEISHTLQAIRPAEMEFDPESDPHLLAGEAALPRPEAAIEPKADDA